MKKAALILWMTVFYTLTLFGQNTSNEGVDFWTVFPSHDPGGGAGAYSYAKISIFITSEFDSEVTVSCGAYTETKTIPAKTAVAFNVTREQAYINFEEQNKNLPNRAIHIKVTDGMPKVAAYAHIYAGARSAATLLLPTESLGQKYFSINYTQTVNGSQNPPARNFIVLVAVEDNTTLNLRQKNGATKQILLLNKGDVYQHMEGNTDDLTGTQIEVDPITSACKRFAAFSGSTGVSIFCAKSRDPLFQQLYATNNWGKNYFVSPFLKRKYLIRVLAKENETKVIYNGVTKILNQGQYLESEALIQAIKVTADKPVCVAQYAFSQECASASTAAVFSDPEMVILNPIEFKIKNITLFSSPKEAITERYVNVVMKTAFVNTFKINGFFAPSGWIKIPMNEDYSYLQLSVVEESITFSAEDGFNAMAYGFGENESYAYSAGTSVLLGQFMKIKSQTSGSESMDACVSQNSNMIVYSIDLLSKITWKIDGMPDIIDLNPIYTIEKVNGDDYYKYENATTIVFNTLEEKKAIVEVAISSLGGCLARNDSFEFVFKVNELPKSDFTFGNLRCSNQNVSFKDKSTSALKINKWIWDFGDGSQPSTEQNPSHIYNLAGIYRVKLMAGLEDACLSNVFEKEIEVFKSPKVDFKSMSFLCENGDGIDLSSYVEESTSSTGKFSFQGEGVFGKFFDPKTVKVGIHPVIGSFTTDKQCVNSAIQNIEVIELPKLNIGKTVYLPKGENKVIKASFSGLNAKYKWTPSLDLDNDSVLNPVVSTQAEREYTLTITTSEGCVLTDKVWVKQQQEVALYNAFSPNGDGINDIWKIENITHYEGVVLQVFNRYGERIFSQKGDEITPFDGTFNGKKLPFGVYYYTLTLDGGKKSKSGSITILE
ncbi:MAG: gliding motility-associated C-terminal domain-containing protein [Sphingobacteriaceae bacterium]|nr:gliding motility-associated C-terminal domain-containing protein [Sphingobacteriaceae bacterium]